MRLGLIRSSRAAVADHRLTAGAFVLGFNLGATAAMVGADSAAGGMDRDDSADDRAQPQAGGHIEPGPRL